MLEFIGVQNHFLCICRKIEACAGSLYLQCRISSFDFVGKLKHVIFVFGVRTGSLAFVRKWKL